MGSKKKTAGKTAPDNGIELKTAHFDEARDHAEALEAMTPEVAERIAEEPATSDAAQEKEIEPSVRFGRLPDWKFSGWQFVFFFGRVPDPEIPVSLMLGWKTFLIGIFKVKELPPEGQEITSENIRGMILQGQVWFPLDRFGKL